MSKVKRLIHMRELYLVIILLAIIVGVTIGNPKFLTPGNLQNIIINNFEIGLICVTMTFIIIMGGMDMSVGAAVSLAGMLAGFLMVNFSMNPILAILIAIAACAVVGAINGTMTIMLPNSNPMIITIGTMVLFQSVSRLMTEGWPVSGFPLSFAYLSYTKVLGINITILILFLAFLAGQWFLSRTVTGVNLYAIGSNEDSSYYAGIRVKRVKLMFYIASGVMAGLAGIFLTSRMQTGYPDAGNNYHMEAIAAIVIGGADIAGGEGSMFGSLLGFLIIASLKNGLSLMGVSPLDQMVLTGAVLIFTIWMNNWQKKRQQARAQKLQQLS